MQRSCELAIESACYGGTNARGSIARLYGTGQHVVRVAHLVLEVGKSRLVPEDHKVAVEGAAYQVDTVLRWQIAEQQLYGGDQPEVFVAQVCHLITS